MNLHLRLLISASTHESTHRRVTLHTHVYLNIHKTRKYTHVRAHTHTKVTFTLKIIKEQRTTC